MAFQNALQLFQKGDFSKALKALKADSSVFDVDFNSAYLAAICCFKLGQFQQCVPLANKAISLTSNKQQLLEVYWLLANSYLACEDCQKAQTTLIKSIELDEGESSLNARMKLVEISHRAGQFDFVEHYGPALLNFERSKIVALNLLIKSSLQSFDRESCLKRLSLAEDLINSKSIELLVVSVHAFIKLNEYNRAQALLQKFSRLGEGQAWYQLLYAIVDNHFKRYEQAIERIENVTASDLPDWFGEEELLFKTLGHAYDSIGDFELAYQTYTDMGRYYERKYAKLEKFNVIDAYQNVAFKQLPSYQGDCFENIVFMLGFPRSGTTLLETILDTHEQVQTLSEPHTISAVADEVIKMFGVQQYPTKLNQLTQEQMSHLRELYFNQVKQLLPNWNKEQLLIDKMPLYSLYIPLIKALFPTAKFIINIRHPLDVVISNWQQNFTVNNEMAYFFTLESSIARYQEVMMFLEKMYDNYQLNDVVIRYEDLTADIETEVKRMFAHINVEYDKRVLDFHLHAKKKVVNTPSSSQVSQPLYSRSVYKWLNYKEHMTDAKSQLSHFITKYGYQE